MISIISQEKQQKAPKILKGVLILILCYNIHMKILICGAGPAGLAVANFINKEHTVTIAERSNEFTTMGFGIFFFNEGKQILNKATHHHSITKYLKKIDYRHYQTEAGDSVASVQYNRLFHVDPNNSITSIKREDLHALLLQNLPKHVTLQMGTCIRKIENTANKAFVTFNNGEQKVYDLVIGADGAQSSLRQQFFNYTIKQLPWRARYFWLNKTSKKFSMSLGKHALVYCMPHKQNTTILAIENMAEDISDTVCPELQKLYHSFGMKKPDIQAAYANSYTTAMRYIFTKEWFNKSIVLIGDAQHAMTPTLGYGTSLALDDAYELAAHINKANEFNTKQELLESFSKKRNIRINTARSINRIADFVYFKNSKLYYLFWYSHKKITFAACEALDAVIRLGWKFSTKPL